MTLTTCKTCGFEFEPCSLMLFGHAVAQFNCEACVQVYEERQALEQAESEDAVNARKASRWALICDPLYSDTDPLKLPLAAHGARLKAIGWAYGPNGLVLFAPSGSGKTRIAFEILKREYDAGRSVVAINPSQFRQQYSQAAQDQKAEAWMDRLTTRDVVLFDDLGQMRLTEASEETLWAVIEGRSAAKKPSIFTTQYSGKELVAQFLRPNRGVSIERRLKEFNSVISF